jgi:hypothetical protein
MLEKTEGATKNSQSRDTGNIMNKTQIYKTDAQHRNLKDEQRGSNGHVPFVEIPIQSFPHP